RTSVVAIAFDGRTETTLLKALQRDPRSGQIVHIDFQAVSMEEEVTSVVPVRFVGESAAVAKLDGVMMHPRTELHVIARAADLPAVVEVDLSVITDLHGAIHVSALPLSSLYRVTDPQEEVLAIVLPPKREVEVEEAAAPEAGAPAEAMAEAGEAESPAQSEQE